MHDKHTIHVSHYQGSPTWRSAVAPEDRSWILFVDTTGAPHLYLATETQDHDGHDVTTYAPAVRAMLRPEERAEVAPLAGVSAVHTLTIKVGPSGDGSVHAYTAATNSRAAGGATACDAVVALLDYVAERSK